MVPINWFKKNPLGYIKTTEQYKLYRHNFFNSVAVIVVVVVVVVVVALAVAVAVVVVVVVVVVE